MAKLEAFTGVMPYDSELFGVYQPIAGWKSRHHAKRVERDQLENLQHLMAEMKADSRIAEAVERAGGAQGPDAELPPRIPDWMRSSAIDALVQGVAGRAAAVDRVAGSSIDWPSQVNAIDFDAPVRAIATTESSAILSLEAVGEVTPQKRTNPSPRLIHEAVVAGTLKYLARAAPSLLGAVVEGRPPRWKRALPFVDPLAHFDVEHQKAVLSPIGLIHLYREYFFELETFLGPSVGHVWVSPGGSLEVFEVHTTHQSEERTSENTTETTSSSETTSQSQDELSSAVSKDNSQNMSVGVSASGGVNFGVFQSSLSASFNFATATKTAQQDSHKETRSQSEKLSSQIRKSLKTTFKTSLEQDDQYSRRYVLQNTSDKLVNYELRRKMRRVAVQTQHIGTQLCWEIFIDEPGHRLGLPELVHVAKPDDDAGIQPPEAPQPLETKEQTLQVTFQFDGIGDNDDWDEHYIDGMEDGDPDDSRIRNTMEVRATPPAADYVIDSIQVVSFVGPDPSDEPSAVVSFDVHRPEQNAESKKPGPDGHGFTMRLDEVNFDDQPWLIFTLNVVWRPRDPNAGMDEYKKALAAYTAAERKTAHASYVSEVRSRIEACGEVQKRPADDLRAEERSVVYGRLIKQLMHPAHDSSPHVASELIRGIFDVDQMLYFVSPDWWMPRKHQRKKKHHPHHADKNKHSRHHKLPAHARGKDQPGDDDRVQRVRPDDVVTWDGENDPFRDNYLVTEDSVPAPLGASLGWLLQLDGDQRRNAFLNAPWVKAVIPIRPGREKAALAWLKSAAVEGTKGLDAAVSSDPELPATVKTIEDAIDYLATQVDASHSLENMLSGEKVFDNGFDPLEGGFEAKPFEVFDQWVEILPTDQVVAVEYDVTKG